MMPFWLLIRCCESDAVLGYSDIEIARPVADGALIEIQSPLEDRDG
jgi:hypothetical protein